MRIAKSVLIMAGGTGGHVFPALAVAEDLTARGVQPVWLGGRRGLETRLVPAAGYRLWTIAVSGLRNQGALRWLTAPPTLLAALLHACVILLRLRPAVVLGMGGYASGPGGVAAWLLRRPLLIHEQNALPGTTNRLLAPLATRILEGFPGAFSARPRAVTTGNPVRRDIVAAAARRRGCRPPPRPLRLLVIGGSQGAEVLNRVVPAALRRVPWEFTVWHQTGSRDAEATRRRYAGTARVDAFIDDMAEAYAWADLIIARAGALTLAEIAVVGLASVLVPYPYATDDHQMVNARHLGDAHAAVVIAQADFTPPRLATVLQELTADPQRLADMGARAARQGRPGAAGRVAELCMEYIGG